MSGVGVSLLPAPPSQPQLAQHSPKPAPAPVQGGARARQPSLTSQMAARALNTSQYSQEPCTSLSPLCHESPSLPVKVKT